MNFISFGKESYVTSVVFAPIMSSEKVKNIVQNIILDNPELRNNKPINPINEVKIIYVAGENKTYIEIQNKSYELSIPGYIEKDYGFEHIWIKEGFQL